MGKIEVEFSDGHIFSILHSDSAEEVIQNYINEYAQDHPDVTVVNRTYIDEPTEANDEAAASAETKPEGKDTYHEDEEYIVGLHLGFMGLSYFYKNNPEAMAKYEEQSGKKFDELNETELHGLAKGMSEEQAKDFINRFDIVRSLTYLKHSLQIPMDFAIKDVEDEKVLNILGHHGIITSFNETLNKWQCTLTLRDGVMIHLSDTQLGAGLRGLISRLTATFYTNNDIIDTLSHHWRTVNNIKTELGGYTKEQVEAAAKAVGTSVEEIEQYCTDNQPE